MTRHPYTYRLATVLVAAAFTVASCSGTGGASSSTSSSSSSSTASSSSSTSSSSASPAPPADAKTLRVTINGQDVTPAPSDVELKAGQTLRLIVTDNADNVFHAHGFNKEVNLLAGKPATIDLVTNTPGRYEVETHHPELKLLTVLVR